MTATNYGDTESTATLDITRGQGTTVAASPPDEITFTILPDERVTIDIESVAGGELETVAVEMTCDSPDVVAEFPTYFDYVDNIPGGSVTEGVEDPAKKWYFAEGTTNPGFEKWISLFNTAQATANLTFRYLR